jgi:hypothetical protein
MEKNIKKTIWTQRIEGRLNPNPCGSFPLHANSVIHNPLTLKAILHNAKKNPTVEYKNKIS